jgi:hypothetical protein
MEHADKRQRASSGDRSASSSSSPTLSSSSSSSARKEGRRSRFLPDSEASAERLTRSIERKRKDKAKKKSRRRSGGDFRSLKADSGDADQPKESRRRGLSFDTDPSPQSSETPERRKSDLDRILGLEPGKRYSSSRSSKENDRRSSSDEKRSPHREKGRKSADRSPRPEHSKMEGTSKAHSSGGESEEQKHE